MNENTGINKLKKQILKDRLLKTNISQRDILLPEEQRKTYENTY